jgi:hypothetical protein
VPTLCGLRIDDYEHRLIAGSRVRIRLPPAVSLLRIDCLAIDIRTPEALDDYRPVKGLAGVLGPPTCNPPSVHQITVPTTLSGGEFSAIAGVTDEPRRVKELFRHPRPSTQPMPWLAPIGTLAASAPIDSHEPI